MKSLKRYLLANSLIIFIAFTPSFAQTSIEVSGNIDSDTTWTADTVKVTGKVTILDDVTLTIEPGTIIQFQDYYEFFIYGTIIAIGQSNDSILFTVADTTGFYRDSVPEGGWGGILFDDSGNSGGSQGAMRDNDSSRMSHCIIEYAKGIVFEGMDYPDMSGALYLRAFSKLILEHSQVRYSKAIQRGGGIKCFDNSSPVIRHNLIYNNYAGYGGGIYIAQSEPLISRNIIRNNSNGKRSYGDGGGIYVANSEAIIEYNEICWNNSKSSGGGVFVTDADCFVRNNSIHNNQSTVAAFTAGRNPNRFLPITTYIIITLSQQAGRYTVKPLQPGSYQTAYSITNPKVLAAVHLSVIAMPS